LLPRAVVPDLPAGVAPEMLDPAIRRELRSLAKLTAETVSGQLVAAGMLLESDPQAALAHARAARRIASRVSSVREANGLAAYAAGEYAEALAELRAHRRMSGLSLHIPVMADSERALGRPDKALALLDEAPLGELPAAARAELLLVRSGAYRDLNQLQDALSSLEVSELDSPVIKPWTVRLWYGYAEALLGVNREAEAREWFGAVAAVDDGTTDAAERFENDDDVEAEASEVPVVASDADNVAQDEASAEPVVDGIDTEAVTVDEVTGVADLIFRSGISTS
jgi:tetratricopeptide (TPR) repeat protein